MPLPATQEEYVDVIVEAARRDPSIARVLREICALDGVSRSAALAFVGAHLRTRAAAADVLECLSALEQDAVALRILERLGAPG